MKKQGNAIWIGFAVVSFTGMFVLALSVAGGDESITVIVGKGGNNDSGVGLGLLDGREAHILGITFKITDERAAAGDRITKSECYEYTGTLLWHADPSGSNTTVAVSHAWKTIGVMANFIDYDSGIQRSHAAAFHGELSYVGAGGAGAGPVPTFDSNVCDIDIDADTDNRYVLSGDPPLRSPSPFPTSRAAEDKFESDSDAGNSNGVDVGMVMMPGENWARVEVTYNPRTPGRLSVYSSDSSVIELASQTQPTTIPVAPLDAGPSILPVTTRCFMRPAAAQTQATAVPVAVVAIFEPTSPAVTANPGSQPIARDEIKVNIRQIVVHPQRGDFATGKEGRILITAMYGTPYYTTYQTGDGAVKIRGETPSTESGRLMYFRTIDPPDSAPYATNTTGNDNHEDQNPFEISSVGHAGSLEPGPGFTEDAGKRLLDDLGVGIAGIAVETANDGHGTEFAEAVLRITPRFAGDNYVVKVQVGQMPTDAQEDACPKTCLLTAWKRCYLEVDRMFLYPGYLGKKKAASSNIAAEGDTLYVEDARNCQTDDWVVVFSNEDDSHNAGDLVQVSSVDKSSSPHKILLTSATNLPQGRVYTVDSTTTPPRETHVAALPGPEAPYIGHNPIEMLEKGVVPALNTNVRATWDYAFVEYLSLPGGAGYVPHVNTFTAGSWETGGLTVRSTMIEDLRRYSQKWFANRSPNPRLEDPYNETKGGVARQALATGKEDYFHVICAYTLQAWFDTFPTKGMAEAYGLGIPCDISGGTRVGGFGPPNLNGVFLFRQGAFNFSHELGHQFDSWNGDVRPPTNGAHNHCSNLSWSIPGQTSTTFCIMKHGGTSWHHCLEHVVSGWVDDPTGRWPSYRDAPLDR